MTVRQLLSGAVLAAAATMLMASNAQAFSINLQSAVGGVFTYQVNLASQEALTSGDFVSVFDFGASSGATASIAGFTFTTPLTSPLANSGTGVGVATPPPPGSDDAAVQNLQANYSGATITGTTFTFSATTPLTGTRSDFAYGQSTDQSGTDAGKIATSAPITVPNAAPVAPEPGSLALVATGLMGAMGMVGVRRRRSAK